MEIELPATAELVRGLLTPGTSAWLVGGYVRDALLGRTSHDLDFAVAGDALALARRAANALGGAFYALDDTRDTGRVILAPADGPRQVLDFAGLRGPDIQADLQARDFSINAIAVDLLQPQALVDPTGGEDDLRSRRLRACSATAIDSDPVRALRAVRLAAQFDLHIESDTRQRLRQAASALARVSSERARDELMRIFAGRRPAGAIRTLDVLGLLHPLLPELTSTKGCQQSRPHTLDVWEHSLAAVERLDKLLQVLGPAPDSDSAADLTLGLASVRLGRYRAPLGQHLDERLSDERPVRALLLFAALIHDVGKPATRHQEADGRVRFLEHEQVGAKLVAARAFQFRLSTVEVDRLRRIVQHHLRPLLLSETTVTRRATYRFFRDAGPAGVDVVLLSLADRLATYGAELPQPAWQSLVDTAATLLAAYFEAPADRVTPPALITGHDLMTELVLPSGPLIGQLLEAVREAQASGEVSDREAAIDLSRRLIASGQLSGRSPPKDPDFRL